MKPTLPETNPIYTKVDDKTFYISTTTSTQYNVDALKNEIAGHQVEIDRINGILNEAQSSIAIKINDEIL